MNFTEVQRKLSCNEETSGESEFSISQVLSLPPDFFVFIVKNRREADLLLKVSESSASLDLLTQNYEMFASRAQALQEAWNGLWLAQEPYLVPGIPLIGFEMSGVNSGRSILLEKLDNEFKTLKELGKELCHYIDVNHSLVEELRMEGIERLAVNKLLLVEVEKELVRRITHICSNKSMRDLSPMREFLCQLKKPTSSSMKVGMDENKDFGNSTMNGSCSTEKITTDGSSEALDIVSGDRDVISPDSQSFASKCVSTQGDNMHPPSITTPVSELPAKKLDYEQSHSDVIVTPSKVSLLETRALAGGVDIKPHVRNHSSSASEERLPKAARNGHDELSHTFVKIIEKKDLYERAYKQSGDLPVHLSKEPDVNGSKTHLYREFSPDLLRSSKEGSSKLESTQEQAKVDSRNGCDSDILAFDLLEDKMFRASSHSVLKSFDLDQMNRTSSHALPSTQPDMKGSKRKRLIDCEASIGGMPEGSIDLVARNCKRIMVQASSESTRATVHSSAGTFVTKRKFLHSIEESSHSLFTVGLDEKEGRVNTTTDLCLPCSCDMPNTMQSRCKECGCFLAQVSVHPNQIAGEQDAHIEQGRVSESPIPATQ